MDTHGNLLGMTGGEMLNQGIYAAYQLTPGNGNWSFTVLYSFGNELGPAGAVPTFDSQGNLYGPLPGAGSFGEIFKLTPSGNQWIYSSFYQFGSCLTNGCVPAGTVNFDASGNLYGTTIRGGPSENSSGVVWELTP
jgi:hypothetical protein